MPRRTTRAADANGSGVACPGDISAADTLPPWPPATAGSAIDGEPSREEIAMRAYEIFLARGGEPGGQEEDWLLAERELRARRRTHAKA